MKVSVFLFVCLFLFFINCFNSFISIFKSYFIFLLDRNCFVDPISMVVFLSVLLLPSLLANAVLAHLYYSNGIDWLVSCEPVRSCSDQDVDHNAQIKQFLHKDMENRSQAHHCPQKNFPEKWVQDKGRFYVFSIDVKDWNSSRQRCQDLGGDLVIINSNEEQKFLAKQIHAIGTQTLYWIGLTDSHTEGVWLWVDDTKNHLKQFLGNASR
uniref:Si:ch211-232p21.6 n=1 Tax=Cyprinus carpio TaxID=7962 RepID=A0A8C1XEA5_CYPCA